MIDIRVMGVSLLSPTMPILWTKWLLMLKADNVIKDWLDIVP